MNMQLDLFQRVGFPGLPIGTITDPPECCGTCVHWEELDTLEPGTPCLRASWDDGVYPDEHCASWQISTWAQECEWRVAT